MDTDAYHTLLAATKHYLLQEYSNDAWLECEMQNYQFFKSTYTKPTAPITFVEPKKAPATLQVKRERPKQTKHEAQAIEKKPILETVAPPPSPHPQNYLLQALSRPLSHPPILPIGAIVEMLQSEKLYLEPPTTQSPVAEWKKNYPECVVISKKSSDSFVQKMCDAIVTRLGFKIECLDANLDAAAAVTTYVACKTLKALIIVGDMSQWLSHVSDLELPMFRLSAHPTQEEKGALWKALQKLP